MFIYFSNLIEDKGLNFTNICALSCKVLLGKNVEDLVVGGDVRESKKEVVQHAKAFVFLKSEVVESCKPLFEGIDGIVHHAQNILIDGMLREDGVDMNVGSHKTSSCSAGTNYSLPYNT